METIRLYEQDSFIKEFTGTVVSCEKTEDGYEVVLDRTAFFPEGGGQTADTGWLNGVAVLDAQEKDGVIYHYTKEALEAGKEVKGQLDWTERFRKMQHHSGEHIVSGLIHRHFGLNNVGFHLGSQVVTLDFDGVITKEQLRQVEYEANEAVVSNLPILVTYPGKEELPGIDYRSKIEIEGQVRIVEVPGYDVCACCAPHMKLTGQIGMIKLINMHNYKGGVRIYMLCGFAALADYNEKEESVRKIALSLSAHDTQVAERVENLKEEIFHQKGQIMTLARELLDCKVAGILEGGDRAVIVDSNLEGTQIREMANKILDKNVGLAAVFGGNDENGYRYVLGSRSQDVRVIVKEMNAVLNGRGGGKPEMVQGSVACTKEEIEAFFQK